MKKKGKIIAVSSSKGGPGKTILSGNVADALAILGYKVAALDVDPNQNLTDWFNKGKEISKATGQPNDCFMGITLETQMEDDQIVKDCRRLAMEHDFVIVDVAGVKSQSLYVAAGAAALVIIPATPSEDDFKEALKTKKIVASAAEMISERLGKEIEINTRIVINATQTNTVVHEHIAKELERRNIPVFKTTVGFRTIFKKARFMGSTVVRVEPSGTAAREIMSLVEEILALLGVSQDEMKIAS
jgi:chromosome partitioning protein